MILLDRRVSSICLLICYLFFGNGDGKRTVGVFLVLSNSSQYSTVDSLSGIETSLEEVNKRNDILREYELQISGIVIEDGSHSVNQITDLFLNLSLPAVGIIDGAYSKSFLSIWQLLSIPIVSYSPFIIPGPNTVTVSLTLSDSDIINSIDKLIDYAGWNQVALISETEYPFTRIEMQLVQELTLNGKGVKVIRSYSNLTSLFEGSHKILIVNTFEDTARNILCDAYKRNVNYPDYQWILYGWYSEDWLTNGKGSSCTNEQLLVVVERAVVIQHSTTVITQTTGIISADLIYHDNLVDDLAHDAVTTFAKALNKSITNNPMFVEMCEVDELIPNVVDESCKMVPELLKTVFEGKTGYVSFNEDGNRNDNNILYLQFRKGSNYTKLVEFAVLYSHKQAIHFIGTESSNTVWPGGIPHDGSPIEIIALKELSATVILYILATLGLIFTFICLVFNIIFRKRKIVRLTSPNLNYFIIAGATILYGSIYIRMIRTDNASFWTVNCHLIVWTLYLGYSLCLSPYVAKLWRLYYIFHNPTAKKKKIQDWHLAVFVVGEVLVIVLMLTFGSGLPYTRPQYYLGDDLENPSEINEDGIEVNYVSANCFTTISFVLNGVGITFFCVQHGIAIYFALMIRKAKIKALNEYREVTATVCVTSVAMIQGLAISIILQDFETIVESFTSTAIFIATTTFIGFAFIPKVFSLYRDPDGKRIFSETHTADADRLKYDSTDMMLTTHNNNESLELRIKTLEEEIRRLNQVQNKHRDENNS